MMSLGSVTTSTVLVIILTMETTTATASSTTTASAVTSAFPLLFDMFEAVTVVILILDLLFLMRFMFTTLSLAVFATLVMTGMLMLLAFTSSLSLPARRLSLVNLNLFGKLLLDFWEILVGLSIVLVLSIEKTLE